MTISAGMSKSIHLNETWEKNWKSIKKSYNNLRMNKSFSNVQNGSQFVFLLCKFTYTKKVNNRIKPCGFFIAYCLLILRSKSFICIYVAN